MRLLTLILIILFFIFNFICLISGAFLPFWISDDKSDLWIKMNLTSGTQTIYIKTTEGSTGDGNSVFDFFDDFNNGINYSKYYGRYGPNIDNSVLSVTNGALRIRECGSCGYINRHMQLNASTFPYSNLKNKTIVVLSRSWNITYNGYSMLYFPAYSTALDTGNGNISGEFLLSYRKDENAAGQTMAYHNLQNPSVIYGWVNDYFGNDENEPYLYMLYITPNANFQSTNYLQIRNYNTSATTLLNLSYSFSLSVSTPNYFFIASNGWAANAPLYLEYFFVKKVYNQSNPFADPPVSCALKTTGLYECNVTSSYNITDYPIKIKLSSIGNPSVVNVYNISLSLNSQYQNPIYEATPQTINFSIQSEPFNCSLYSANLTYNGSVYYPYFVNGNGTGNLTFGFNLTSPILVNPSSYNLTFTLNTSSDCLGNQSNNYTQTINPAFFSIFYVPPFGYVNQNFIINVTTINLTTKSLINESVYAIYNNSTYSGSLISQTGNNTTYQITIPLTLNNSSNYFELQTIKLYHNLTSTNTRNQTNQTIAVLKPLDSLNYCNNFYTDSGLFDYIVFENKTYYAFNNASLYSAGMNNNPLCNNSGALALASYPYPSSSIGKVLSDRTNSSRIPSATFYFRTLTPFVMNYTLSGYQGYSVCVYNYTNSTCATGGSDYLIFTIENGTAKVKIKSNNQYITIPSNLTYYVVYPSMPDTNNASNIWFFNKDINQRLSNPYYYFTDWITYDYLTAYDIGNNITFATHICQNKLNIGANNLNIVFVYNQTMGIFLKEDETLRYSAYVLTITGNLIKPKWTYNLQRGLMSYKAYSPVNFSQTFISNEGYILIDEFYNCYFVPPFTPSNTSLVYTMTGYQVTCSVSNLPSTNNLVSFIPRTLKCYAQNNSYSIYTLLDVSSSFLVIKTKTDNTTQVEAYSGKEFNYTTPLTNISSLDFKIGNLTKCYYQEGAILLTGFQSIYQSLPQEIKTEANKFFIVPVALLFMGVSVINPFATIGFVIFNDAYQVLPKWITLVLSVFLIIMHILIVQRVNATLKVILFELVLLSSILILITSIAPSITNASISQFTNKINDIRNTFTTLQTNTDIISIITSTIPTFLINVVVLLFSIPALVVNIFFEALTSISPSLASASSWLEMPIVVGVYIYLALKMYEIGRNTFQRI